MSGGETSLGSCFDDYEILNGMMTLRHDDILHRRQNLPIGCESSANQLWSLCQSVVSPALISCDPCANQMRSLRYRPMESSLRPALTTMTRDKQPSASMLSNHRQGLHFCGQTLPLGSCCHSRWVKWGKINSLAIRRLRFVNHYELVWLKTILYFCNIITYRTLNGNIRCD